MQKEVFSGTILQQMFVVEFIMGRRRFGGVKLRRQLSGGATANEQCKECEQFEAKDTWNAVVQVRQKVAHKKTFLWLEQLILRHNAHAQVTNIVSRTEVLMLRSLCASSSLQTEQGLDFFFMKKSHARKMVDFLNNGAWCLCACFARG